MKILAVNNQLGEIREYSSVQELKCYIKNRPWLSYFVLQSWRLYQISSRGSQLPMDHRIRTMHDFAVYHRI